MVLYGIRLIVEFFFHHFAEADEDGSGSQFQAWDRHRFYRGEPCFPNHKGAVYATFDVTKTLIHH